MNMTCPSFESRFEKILLGHGSGGQMTADLLEHVFFSVFENEILRKREDQATLSIAAMNETRLAFTTDSFVVHPIFFPGGDIGSLAVHGTINDLSVGGARPLFLSAAFIIEEGLLLKDLRKVVQSMRHACQEAGVLLVTGDTKVVNRGKGDQLYITTSGIGLIPPNRSLSIANARPGDQVLISGTVGDHGVAILSVREGLAFETNLKSDSAALNSLTEAILTACPSIRCMRDPTRGGIAATLNELATASNVGVKIDEAAIPINPGVKAACEMLGLDPSHVANEGKLIAVVPPESANSVLEVMRAHPLGKNSANIGHIIAEHPGTVTLRSQIGGERIITLLAGEQLPRIC